MSKKKPGRPKGKPLSQKELAQRRGAAWKHGARAQSALRQTVHPCRVDLCPVKDSEGESYPCSAARAVEDQGGALDACVVRLAANPEAKERFLRALQSGELDGLHEMTAMALGALHGLQVSEIKKLVEEGFSIEEEMLGKEGDVLGTRMRVNPRAAPLLELNRQLGTTAEQQALTPKSRGEKSRDEGFGALVDFMATRRKALEGEAGA